MYLSSDLIFSLLILILKIDIDINNKCTISLFYEGIKGSEINRPEHDFYKIEDYPDHHQEYNPYYHQGYNPYYHQEHNPYYHQGQYSFIGGYLEGLFGNRNEHNNTFNNNTFNNNTFNNFTFHLPGASLIHNNITIYVVRHAEGEHNIKNTKYKSWINRLTSILQIPKYIDPSLTQEGINQAQLAAFILSHVQFNYVFASELMRTRETAQIILNHRPSMIHIIPCLHEIADYNRGRCDEFRFNKNLITAPENKSKLKSKCGSGKRYPECIAGNTDWTLYNKFNKCYKYDLITLMLEAIKLIHGH